MTCYVPTCQRANVPTCQISLRANLPWHVTCQRANVPTCHDMSRANVPTCLRAKFSYVPTCHDMLRANVPTCQILFRALLLAHIGFLTSLHSIVPMSQHVTLRYSSKNNFWLRQSPITEDDLNISFYLLWTDIQCLLRCQVNQTLGRGKSARNHRKNLRYHLKALNVWIEFST